MNIIQHHEPIDIEALFKQTENATIGIDDHDLELFAAEDDEIHSFLGSAECKDRIGNAIRVAIGSDEAMKIFGRSSVFLLIVKYNSDCERPLMVEELSAINKFVKVLPNGNDIQWSLMHDSTLDNKVEIILLCNIKR